MARRPQRRGFGALQDVSVWSARVSTLSWSRLFRPVPPQPVLLFQRYPGFSSQRNNRVRSGLDRTLQSAQSRMWAGPMGKMVVWAFQSAWMLTPSADGGRVKLRVFPKMTGYKLRTRSLTIG